MDMETESREEDIELDYQELIAERRIKLILHITQLMLE